MKNMKQEAENMYARAVIALQSGNREEASAYAGVSIEMYKILNPQTLDEATPSRMRVEGVEIPDIMHAEVVRQRLGI
jgi:hypothetical protein